MRLSKLHIAGFKSFPDRSELGFDTGVTAIVGPNGCGKSNVVDAITWVLGEQSAKSLRGERMEDVIFNGSDARKPTATAEVRLKLTEVAQAAMAAASVDADDLLLDGPPILTRDIEIGRRLYRSGESEYLIDGEVCRLRDVHDLLMDSGLGVKAYAVIEQGKIGQILSSRPAERRMLIEEAAGVTKYKSRRRAAELKLEAAEQNVTRIDDIIFEVEKQRGALKRQAARARRYRRLREELRKWEQVQFARRYTALLADVEAAGTRLEAARAREGAAAARVAELEVALEAVRLHLTEAEASATAARERAHAHELEIGKGQQQVQFEKRQIEELAAQGQAFADEARDLEARRGPAAAALARQREAAAAVGQALETARIDVADRERAYGNAVAAVQGVEQEADGMRAAVLASGSTLSALRQARDHAAAVRDRVAAEQERLTAEARDLAAEAEAARSAQAKAGDALAAARAAIAALAATRLEAEAALADARQQREALADARATNERALASKDARLRSLEELDASRATFGDAARFLLAEAPGALRQHGAVADHLIVERPYERAVDALLGEVLQYVIVDRAEDVSAALELLASRNAGRCGFFVLDEATSPLPAESPLVVPPGSRALSGVIKVTGPHAQALSRLIGRALVAESFEAARTLARTVSVPVASATGEVFHGAWLVQGGSRQDVHGILETRAEIRGLREEVERATVRADEITEELAGFARTVSAAEAAVADLVAREHSEEKTAVAAESQTTRTSEDHARAMRRLELVATERARADGEHEASERRRDDATAAIDTQETRQREAEEGLGAVLAHLQAARESAEACLRLVTESRTAQAALIERAGSLDAEVRRLEDDGRDLDARIESRRADVRRTEVRRDELAASIIVTERHLDDEIRALEELKTGMRTIDERVVGLRGEFAANDHAIRGARHDFEAVRSQVTECEVAQARASADLTHLGEACLEAVGITLDDVMSAVERMERAGELVPPGRRLVPDGSDEDEEAETGDPQTASGAAEIDEAAPRATPDEIIAVLRRRIERLGPVNMMAIEQFDELETRHAFLTTQRKDLLDSIAQTGEAIKKIDTTTRERFAAAFESINRHFEGTFTTLFGGGRAGLMLIDLENEQESGIDIIAQPPGKRLQNVQLLSGGEKALTAMALMFAIFKYRPSPFCLLDEIDAPLDDANIGRFIEMLQGMQTHTQFILITHNRKTMEIANRLYGVTMEEPGVSKLISLQLN